MADLKITQLSSLNGADAVAGDLVTVVDITDTTMSANGTNKKMTLAQFQAAPLSGGTANGVAYLNGSKVLTTGSALTFDGSTLTASNSSVTSGNTGVVLTGRYSSTLPSSGAGYFQIKTNNGDATNGGIDILTLSAGALRQSYRIFDASDSAGYQAWNVNGSEKMRLTSTGLGIGTSSPTERLTVFAANPTNGVLANINNTSTVSPTGAYLQYGNDGVGYWRTGIVAGSNAFVFTDVINGERMRLDSSGNLGLGVPPSAWGSFYKAMSVSSVNTSFYSFWDGTQPIIGMSNGGVVNTSFVWQYSVSGRAVSRYSQEGNGSHTWFTAPSGTAGNAISFTQAMTLDASGRLAIGATSASNTLDVAASGGAAFRVYDSADVGRGLEIKAGSAASGLSIIYTNTSTRALAFGTNNTERARIDSSGNLIQTVNTTAATLATNNTLTFSIVDNSTLRISVRGSDGTTRTATVALT